MDYSTNETSEPPLPILGNLRGGSGGGGERIERFVSLSLSLVEPKQFAVVVSHHVVARVGRSVGRSAIADSLVVD